MVNILLTARRSYLCALTREEFVEASNGRMSWENLIYIADFLWESGRRHISLLSEAMPHPEWTDFVRYLVDRGFALTVFLNDFLGSTLKELTHHLVAIPPDRLNIVWNIKDPEQIPASSRQGRKLHEFLDVMGPWTSARFDIYRPDFALDFVFEVILRYGMRRHLLLGLAHPMPDGKGRHIRPQDIRQVVERLYSHREFFDTYRVSPSFDCGFPLCKFTDEELGWLHRFPGQSRCFCSPAIDIAPDMSVQHCSRLAGYKRKSLFEFDNQAQIDAHFTQLRSQIKSEVAGFFEACDGCRYLESTMCGGGGLCHIVCQFIHGAPTRVRGIEHEISKARVPR